MEKNRILIVVIIAVIAILAIGIFMGMSNTHKIDTNLTINADSPIYEGDSIKIKLTDLNNTPISNQTVNVTITDKDNTSEYYSVVTNAKGVAKLKLDKDKGKYKINCTYGGNENYTGNSTVKKIKIEKEVVKAQTSSSSSSSSSGSDGYTYSAQKGGYVKNSGQWSSDSGGNSIYSYKGGDGVIYERYYDSNGKEISTEDYYN